MVRGELMMIMTTLMVMSGIMGGRSGVGKAGST